MKFSQKHSVATLVIITLVGIVTLVLVLVSVAVYQAYSRQSLNELKEEMTVTADQIAAGTALPLWNVEQVQVLRIMESFMQDPVVYGMEIDSGIKVILLGRDAEWKIREARKDDFKGHDLLSEKRDIIFSGDKIATVEVFYTPRFYQKKLADLLWLLIVGIALIDVALISMLYFILWRSVLYPLKLIESYAVSVSLGKRDDALVSKALMTGEFAQVRGAIQKMLGMLDAQIVSIKESNDRFWSMVENFPIPLAIYTPTTGKINFVNQKYIETLGFALVDLPDAESFFVNAIPNESYRQQVMKSWSTALDTAYREHKHISGQHYTLTSRGGKILQMNISGVLSGDYVLAILNDVTEQMAAEEQVRNYQVHLEVLVQQRTAELVTARDLAEKANRAKSVFLSSMSHELRTPLNAILGFARLLGYDRKLDDDGRKKLSTINRAGEHLLSLINDVLEISRIEAGKAISNRAPFVLADLLSEIEEIIDERAVAKGLTFQFEHGIDPLQVVEGDAHHLKQILINLLGNAVKYTEKGRVLFKVSRSNEAAHFEIIDTGPGIADEDQLSLFQPFYQTESGITKGEGTGLGLSISQQYTVLLGGSLSVVSQLGQGSVFTLTIPLPITDDLVMKRNPGRVLGLAQGQQQLRVLVVDDKEDNRALVRELLEIVGFRVLTADNGEQAITSFQTWHPHFIWMDMRMPVLDGYEATKQIRKLPGGDKVKIVALTASVFEEDKPKMIAAGCDDMVRKPIEESRLFDVMEKFLGVRYQYANAEKKSEPMKFKLDLSALPSEQLLALHKAARELDLNRVRNIVSGIAASHPELAVGLDELVQGFRFDHIVALCGDVS